VHRAVHVVRGNLSRDASHTQSYTRMYFEYKSNYITFVYVPSSFNMLLPHRGKIRFKSEPFIDEG
jgi:hypothetical protein